MPYLKENADISTPLKAIKAFCYDCCGGDRQWVRECPDTKCALNQYRLGKNPNRKTREYTKEEKEKLRERVKKARESMKY